MGFYFLNLVVALCKCGALIVFYFYIALQFHLTLTMCNKWLCDQQLYAQQYSELIHTLY